MNNDEKRVPEIRFKDFSGDWEQRKLNKLANFRKGKGYSKSDLVKHGFQIILYGRLYTNYQTVIDAIDTFVELDANSIRSKKGDVIVPASGESANDISRASVVPYNDIILGGDLNIIECDKDKINSIFLALTLSNGRQKKELSRRAQGKSIVHLRNSDLKQVSLNYPTLDEQIKISHFFKQLENTIALHQDKLRQLKQLKKGYLQVMFPQKGEDLPKLRFANFHGKWEQRKLGELVTLTVREVPKPNKSYDRISIRSHAKGTFHQTVENPSTVSMDKLYVVRENDLIINITFAWEHAIAVASKEDDGLLVSHRFPTYIIDKSDVNFIRYSVIQEEFRRKMDLISPGGAGRNRVLNKKDFIKLKLIVPIGIKEQAYIGEFINKLYEIISLQQTKLEKLQSLKQAYLQKMLI